MLAPRAALLAGLLSAACSQERAGDDSGSAAQVPADLSDCFFDASCPYVLSCAHRGAARFAPENTLAAIDKALELGANSVELDVRTSADGVLVLMHDSDVDRTTDGSGDVDQLTWEQLQALGIPSEFEGVDDQRVPSFLEALEHVAGSLVVDVDVKDASAEDLAADIGAAGMTGAVFLLTKSLDKAEAYRAADPDIAIMPNLDDPAELEDYQHLDPELLEADVLDIAEAAELAAAAGVRVFSHGLGFEAVAVGNGTVEDSWLGMIEDGAQVIQTDYPELLADFLGSYNAALAR